MPPSSKRQDLRYQADETPSYAVSFGLAFQYILLNIAGIVITVAIVVRAGGGTETYLTWAAFATLIVCGISTLLQARSHGKDRGRLHPADGHLGGVHRGFGRGAAARRTPRCWPP